MPSRIGQMRHRVEIQSQDSARDKIGGVAGEYATEATWWASVVPLSGREFYEAQQIHANVTHRVTLRHYEGLDADFQFLHNGRVLSIAHVTDFEERGRFHECMCIETTRTESDG